MTGALRRPTDAWLRVLSLLGCFAAWQATAQLGGLPLLPSPVVVMQSLWRHTLSGELLAHLGITLLRVAASFVIAMAIGTALGIVMGRHRWIDAGLDGLLVLALNVPALVPAILCYIWLGLPEGAAAAAR